MTDDKIIILGSGMAGLGASYLLNSAGIEAQMFDKNSYPGGHTASFTKDSGFIFDDGPHISFTRNERLQKLFAANVDQSFETLQAYVNNYFQGTWLKHPAQANLHNLPSDLKAACLLDFISADKTEVVKDPANYQEWLISVFGESFAKTFPAVYGKKYHTVCPEKMSTVWMGPRLYRPSMEEVVRGAFCPETPDVHYASHFRYPKKGGFVAFLEPFIRQSRPKLNYEVTKIDPVAKQVQFNSSEEVAYDHLISSIPLPVLISMIEGVPENVRAAAKMLACSTCVTINIGVGRNDFTEAAWSYFYDEDIVFTRLSFPHLMSAHTCPPSCGAIQAECYYSDKYRPLDVQPTDLIEPVLADLRKVGLLEPDDDILHTDAQVIPFANIIFDLDRETALPIVSKYLDEIGITAVGRYGEWGYQWTDESFLSGEMGAYRILTSMGVDCKKPT